ncbi:hypothetical protein QUG02_15995 [Bacillus hominis]|uniref:Uncharacterized protein n=1 Tax=Bacillus hominis TaxID=2817478 RepID=A0ABT7R9G3_9BACI|nr:hypothetical protein [Bacillus hominis]MDM5194451.1 hypothetical protein [Bacillus hominis]MDM5434154.1 hypothetical protein [Bacillus hominis]MDM5439576.1 hypothetical protein [Bacillus hominis]
MIQLSYKRLIKILKENHQFEESFFKLMVFIFLTPIKLFISSNMYSERKQMKEKAKITKNIEKSYSKIADKIEKEQEEQVILQKKTIKRYKI